mgnify:CR=1 FL=1
MPRGITLSGSREWPCGLHRRIGLPSRLGDRPRGRPDRALAHQRATVHQPQHQARRPVLYQPPPRIVDKVEASFAVPVPHPARPAIAPAARRMPVVGSWLRRWHAAAPQLRPRNDQPCFDIESRRHMPGLPPLPHDDRQVIDPGLKPIPPWMSLGLLRAGGARPVVRRRFGGLPRQGGQAAGNLDAGGRAVDATRDGTGHGATQFAQQLTIFALSCFVGFQVIWSVAPALHTPLMSVPTAISGIIVVGGILSMERALSPEPWVQMAIWVPLTLILSLALLPRIKGALVGLQWGLRMHGFGGKADEAEPDPADAVKQSTGGRA